MLPKGLYDNCKMFLNIAGHYGKLQPKHHMLCHVVARAIYLGNPWQYNNFRDEGFNATLKRASRYCHQSRYEAAILTRMRYLLLKPQGVKRAFEI